MPRQSGMADREPCPWRIVDDGRARITGGDPPTPTLLAPRNNPRAPVRRCAWSAKRDSRTSDA
jgi:hypothetical protein